MIQILISGIPFSRFESHKVSIRSVEAESGGRQSIGDQVDPEELHGNQRFLPINVINIFVGDNVKEGDESYRHSNGGREEDGDDFADVGGDEIANELLGIGVDGTTLLYRHHDRSEVIILYRRTSNDKDKDKAREENRETHEGSCPSSQRQQPCHIPLQCRYPHDATQESRSRHRLRR